MLWYFDLVTKHAQNNVISGSMPRRLQDTSDIIPTARSSQKVLRDILTSLVVPFMTTLWLGEDMHSRRDTIKK